MVNRWVLSVKGVSQFTKTLKISLLFVSTVDYYLTSLYRLPHHSQHSFLPWAVSVVWSSLMVKLIAVIHPVASSCIGTTCNLLHSTSCVHIFHLYTECTQPASVVLLVASRYALPGYGDRRVWVRGPGWPDHRQVIVVYALRLNSRAGTEGSTVSSLICDRWLLVSETLSISRYLNHW